MESNAKTPPSLTPCDLVVLATLAYRPHHGYDLWKALEAADVADWAPVSRPQVYYSLKKLQGLALIAEKPAASPAAGPKKQVFAATRPGRAALRKNLAEPFWAENRTPPPFTTWAALSLALSEKEKLKQVARRRMFLEKELARERATLKELAPYDAETADLARSLIGLAIDLFRTELAWLDRFEGEIETRSARS